MGTQSDTLGLRFGLAGKIMHMPDVPRWWYIYKKNGLTESPSTLLSQVPAAA
jgi:hypothetical protein